MSSSISLTIFTDGGARGNPGPAAMGIVIYDSSGEIVHEHQEYLGEKTNNEAEYSAFEYSLRWLSKNAGIITKPVSHVSWKLDSLLVVEQLNKKWKVKEPRLQKIVTELSHQLSALSFPFTIAHVPRKENAYADKLVNQALDSALSH